MLFFSFQALHFCYGLGAFISPIVAEPFLINKDCSSFVSPNSTSDELIIPVLRDLSSQGVTDALSTMDGLERAKEGTRVRYAFWIMSLIQVSPSKVGPSSAVCRMNA